MFTGIIETTGKVISLQRDRNNLHILVQSDISNELKIDQSISHNGVCLTVVKVDGDLHTVTAVEETLLKSNLGKLNIGDEINLERCLKIGDRLDGHMVQGHVDTTAELIIIENKQGSYLLTFSFPSEFSKYVVEKGSICLNGISLTVVNVVGGDTNHGPESINVGGGDINRGLENTNVVGGDTNHEHHLSVGVFTNQNIFSVAIIPYTWENTNLQKLKIGDAVNIEFDVIGKYVERMMQFKNQDEVDLSDMHG